MEFKKYSFRITSFIFKLLLSNSYKKRVYYKINNTSYEKSVTIIVINFFEIAIIRYLKSQDNESKISVVSPFIKNVKIKFDETV